MIVSRPRRQRAASVQARAEQVLLFGALGLLLLSAALGDAAAGGAGGAVLATHGPAGSVGWLALAALAIAARMSTGHQEWPPWAGGLAWLTVWIVTGYVLSTATGSTTAQGWTGAFVLIVIVVFLAFLANVMARVRAPWTVPKLSMAAALLVLVGGTVLDTLSAVTAAGNASAAARLDAAHSAVLVVPFVVLVATAAVEWAVAPQAAAVPPTTAGLVQVGALALGAVAVAAGVLAGSLTLFEANIPLELGGIAIFGVRVGPVLLRPGWATGGRIWLVTATVALAIDVGLFAHVVFEIGARRYISVDTVPRWLLFTVDHVTFIGVGTTAMLGTIGVIAGLQDRWHRADIAATVALTAGLAGTAASIAAGSARAESIAGTILALALTTALVLAILRTAAITRADPA